MKQSTLYSMPLAIAATVLALFLAAPAVAAEDVGRVLAASGTVTASTPGGGTRVLNNDSRVYQGEIIETRDGRVQIRFIDEGLVTLDPGSRFVVERYEQRDAAAGDPDDGGSVFMNFLRGALRTITGSIGDGEDETYDLQTPVATVGIRGTQFSLEMCEDGSCGADVEDGLYGHIGEGQITVRNDGGDEVFRNGSFFRVTGPDQRPVQILEPPGFVLGGTLREALAEIGAVEGDEESVLAAVNRLLGRVGDEDLLDGATIVEYSESDDTGAGEIGGSGSGSGSGLPAVATGFINAGISDGGACVSGSGCSVDFDGNDNIVSSDAGSSSIAIGSDVGLVDSGTVSTLDARWGHWSGEMVVDGSVTSGDFLWAYSNQSPSTSQLADALSGTGSVQYTASGGPSPVGDLNGSQWVLSSLSMDILLGSGVILAGDVNLSLSGPDLVVLTNGTEITISDVTFQTALVDSNPSGFDSGDLQATFAGSGAEGMIVQYEASNRDVDNVLLETIQGVQVLEKR